MPVTPAPPRFGRYTLLRPIGRGGMGAVYEAEHVHLGKRVALKTLHAPALAEAESVARFLREGRAAARVRHPHVVDVTDVGVEDGVPYLVMELLDGEDLAAKLRREGPLPVTEALDLLLPVMAAVDAMHAAGVVHRDLKPENLFLSAAPSDASCPRCSTSAWPAPTTRPAPRAPRATSWARPSTSAPSRSTAPGATRGAISTPSGWCSTSASAGDAPTTPPRSSGCSRRSARGGVKTPARCARTSPRGSARPSMSR